MNERIRELAYKAGLQNHLWLDISDSDDVLDTVKFAELIVKECAQKLENDGMVEVAMEIKQHFGIK